MLSAILLCTLQWTKKQLGFGRIPDYKVPIVVNRVFSSGTRSHHQIASGQVFDQMFSTLLESVETPFSSTMCPINFFRLLRKKYFSEVNFKFWLHILRQSLHRVQILRDHQSSGAKSIVLVPKIAGHHRHKVPRAVATVLWQKIILIKTHGSFKG